MTAILIRNAQVIDGSGAPAVRADVAIAGDRIREVGALTGADAELVLDAAGCVVTPGFVDMHSHADFSLPLVPTAESMVHQGITSAVVGQCGASTVPLFRDTRGRVIESYHSADMPLPWDEWNSFGSYVAYLSNIGISVNVVPLVGQGTLRAGVMAFAADPARPEQIARMQAEVERAMDEGAIGVSAGLIYPPGSYASTEELIAVAKPAGARGGFYFSHIRGEGDTLLEAVSEAIRIGRETGASVQISHFKASGKANWHKSEPALELIDRACAEGLDVTADMYPYLAGSTGLTATLPEWAQEGGKAPTLARLSDPATRRRIAGEMGAHGTSAEHDWNEVFISASPCCRAYEGKPVDVLAQQDGKPPVDWVLDALVASELDMQMIAFGMSDENRRRELGHPSMMIGTDGYALTAEGPLAIGKPHPRNFGTFPRVLGLYVRQQQVISLHEAIHRMTGLPARKLRWSDRGLVRAGYKADLVVLNPAEVIDRATFEVPHQYPAGIRHVLVNGRLVVRDGVHTGSRPGLVLGR